MTNFETSYDAIISSIGIEPIQIGITLSDSKEKRENTEETTKKPCVCSGLQVKNVTNEKTALDGLYMKAFPAHAIITSDFNPVDSRCEGFHF